MPLTQTQIDDLRVAYQHALATGGKAGAAIYYSELAKHFTYGALALDVQREQTLAGITANIYATNKLTTDLEVGYSTAQQEAVRIRLMTADFDRREQNGWNDLSGRTISDYHDLVFSNVYSGEVRAPEAWTAYHIVRAFNDYESWLTTSTMGQGAMFVSMEAIASSPSLATNTRYQNAYEWTQDMVWWSVIDYRTYDYQIGDNVLGRALIAFIRANQPGSESFISDLVVPISTEGAAADNPLYSRATGLLFQDVIQSNPGTAKSRVEGIASERDGVAVLKVAKATAAYSGGNEWLNTLKQGAKLSVFGEFNQKNWKKVETPPSGLQELFGRVDGFAPSEVVLEVSGSSVKGTSQASALLLGGAGHGSFNAGAQETFVFAGAGADFIDAGKRSSSSSSGSYVHGGNGADYILGGEGKATIDGGGGDDYYDLQLNYQNDGGVLDITVEFTGDWGHDAFKRRDGFSGVGATVLKFNELNKADLRAHPGSLDS